MSFIYLLIIFIIVVNIINKSKTNIFPNELKLRENFSNVEKVFSTSTMTLYKGDKSGENFLLAIKSPSRPTSKLDLSTIYDIAEKYHLHNKILFTNEKINSNPSLSKGLKEYDIRVLNSFDFQKITSSSESSSILETSDTSDDNCEIDESTSPIKYQNSNGIFSFLKNKSDRL